MDLTIPPRALALSINRAFTFVRSLTATSI